jgi:hypothetical protein
MRPKTGGRCSKPPNRYSPYATGHTFVPGTLLSFLEAAKRSGIRSDRQRYYDAIKDLEYEGAIEWDESARYARGNKHYLITERGLKML